jgi:Ca2+-binding EF-hand superfamily protein
LFDADSDGKLNFADVSSSLRLMVGEHLTEEEVTEVVNKVFNEADGDGDGFITIEDFTKVVANTDIEARLTMDL